MADREKLTISAAARVCGVTRRTLQRAIHTGRLHLDADYCLDRHELLAAGYLALDESQPASQEAPQSESQAEIQDTSQGAVLLPLLERLAIAVEVLGQEVRALHDTLRQTPQGTAQGTAQGTPHRTRQRPAPVSQAASQETPQAVSQVVSQSDVCPPFDRAKNVLGRLCSRGHEWGTTGQTLRRLPNQSCPACENLIRRERRAARRAGQ